MAGSNRACVLQERDISTTWHSDLPHPCLVIFISPSSVCVLLHQFTLSYFFKNISCLYVDWCVWWVSCLHVPLVPAEVSRGQAEPLELELWILVNNHVLGTEPGPLLEQPGLFATEPSLQPLVLFFRWFFSHLLNGCDQLRVYKHLVFGCF